MGNSKSQPKATQPAFPRGDIFGQPKAMNRFQHMPKYRVEQPKYGTGAMQTIEQSRVSAIHEFKTPALPCNLTAYEIHRSDMNIEPEQMNQLQAAIDKHAQNDFENEKRARQIRLEREKAISEFICNKASPKPRTSISALCDFAKRYANFSRIDKSYFSPKPDRPELTEEMLKIIDNSSKPHPAQEVLSQIDGVDLSRKDFHTLTGLNWLNDEIINAYMSLIVARGKQSGQKPVYAFNTFFYPKLRDSGYASVKRWTRKVDIFSYSFLLIPIHLGNHWCLAVVDFTTRTISYYDSLGGRPNGCCDTLLGYLRCESNDKKKQDFDDENWRLINSYSETGIPEQQNGSDCGVFACIFAEYLTRKAKLNFSQEHMEYFRRKMIYELITKQLLQ